MKWNEKFGIGYEKVEQVIYGKYYFDKYEGYAHTEMGIKITEQRIELVSMFESPELTVDIGIGCGDFVKRSGCRGYDINPVGIELLESMDRFINPYESPVKSITCWDSLEHIKNPRLLLDNVLKRVFMSIPIFTSYDHAICSKHYRPDEHYWYFTEKGLERYMTKLGFSCIYKSKFEIDLGREDISSYVFERINYV